MLSRSGALPRSWRSCKVWPSVLQYFNTPSLQVFFTPESLHFTALTPHRLTDYKRSITRTITVIRREIACV